jgi:hypothetical protein
VFVNYSYNIFDVDLRVVSAHPSTAIFWTFVTERAMAVKVDEDFVGLIVSFQGLSQVMQDRLFISFSF